MSRIKTLSYITSGTCSKRIDITVDNDIVLDACFVGGCNGNTTGISRLVRGMKIDDVINALSGIRCGIKGTSCPDQLAKELMTIKK